MRPPSIGEHPVTARKTAGAGLRAAGSAPRQSMATTPIVGGIDCTKHWTPVNRERYDSLPPLVPQGPRGSHRGSRGARSGALVRRRPGGGRIRRRQTPRIRVRRPAGDHGGLDDQRRSSPPGTTQLPPNCATANPALCHLRDRGRPGHLPDGVQQRRRLTATSASPSRSSSTRSTPTTGRLVKAVTVPDNPAKGDYLTTSFSSKSELAVNQSTDGEYDTFIGYVAPPGAIDASNANTPGEIDPTIADSATPTYRAVAQVNALGPVGFTETNAFSGDNGRAAVLDPEDGPQGTIFAVGNAGNGANPEPAAVIDGAGSQIITPARRARGRPEPGHPDPVRQLQRHRARRTRQTSPARTTTTGA